ncbi:protein disulfide isomerase CRELD2-like isoform X2 [Liolophura sinensis]|uniref:protein disulfide isomerase CRELD2-like isoform X2 n=1 Tax=Liolophura sinensis TaxID=3198878 RepID=UPI0031594912
MQTLNRIMSAFHIQRYKCIVLVLLIMLTFAPVDFVLSIQLNNPRGPLKGKCPVCRDIVRDFHNGLKKTAKSNYGGGNTKWEESRLGSYAYSEVRLTEIMESLCSGTAAECHHLLEEHEELVEQFWFKEYAKQKDTDFFEWFCIDRIKVCCPNNTFGPNCKPCEGGLKRPCKDNGFCEGEGTREGTGKCVCHSGYNGDRCDECKDGYYEASSNDTHTDCQDCDNSCKYTCQEAGPKGCDECKEGYMDTEENGCEDIDECTNKPELCGKNFYCENTPGSFSCIKCDNECLGCTAQGTDKCTECRSGYHLIDGHCKDVDECSLAEPVCTKDHEKCTNREGGYTCICDIGYEREGDECKVRPKESGEETDDNTEESLKPSTGEKKEEL